MKNKFIHKSILFICIAIITSIQSQSLLDKLDKEFSNIVFDEIATFKTTRLGFSVEDLDKTVHKLQELSIAIHTLPKQTRWGYRAVVEDFDGRKVELIEKKRRLSP